MIKLFVLHILVGLVCIAIICALTLFTKFNTNYHNMSKEIINGDKLQLFINGQTGTPAWATNHTLTLSTSTQEIGTKDHGVWNGTNVTKISWELTGEYLANTVDYNYFFDNMVHRRQISVKFAQVSNYNENGLQSVGGPVEYWIAGENYWQGNCIISNLQLNAPTGENATVSITLTGTGPLIKHEAVFSVSKTVDWTYEQTDYPNEGDGQIRATFLFDTSTLPQDAHLTESDFWSYITITSESHIHYELGRGINPYEVDVWYDMGQSTSSVQDTITFKYTDASNEQHIAVPVNNANVVNWVNPLGEFTFNKTFGWQDSTVGGGTKITAYFQLDVSALPDDANLQAANWYSHITVESTRENTYTVSEWPQNDWMIMLEVTINSAAASFSDNISLIWTDAENVEYIATPLNNSDVVTWDPITPADPTPAEPLNP